MYKPEWGTKRTCPKCGTRFYDLGKEEPVGCVSCAHSWMPEPVLKSKQPIPMDEEAPKKVVKEGDDEDLDIDTDLAIEDDDMLDDVSLDDEDDDDMADVLGDREQGDE